MPLSRLVTPATTSGRRLLADPGGLAVSITFYLLVSTVLGALWRAAAGSGGSVVGYSGRSLTWYAFVAEAAVVALNVRLIEEVGDDIAAGTVTVEMLRPLPVIAVRLATESGRALARLAVLLAFGVPAAWATAGPPPSVAGVAQAVPSLVLAVCANLALQYAVAAAAFWFRDARAAWFLYQKLVFILGGMLLPLEVLPGVLHAVASMLPFAAMAYVPARAAAGRPEPLLIAVQAGWLVVLVVSAAAAFAAGQRRVAVTGG